MKRPKTPQDNIQDYAGTGTTIQSAMVQNARKHPGLIGRPRCIIWNAHEVWTSYELHAPLEGLIRITFLSPPRNPLQGVDIKVESGAVFLQDLTPIKILRTWHDMGLPESVEYKYSSNEGIIRVWNVYQRVWPDGRISDEKWSGNAGFMVEHETELEWIFRCSSGLGPTPKFDELVFRLSLQGLSSPPS